MTDIWLKAAKRYETAKKPGFKSGKKRYGYKSPLHSLESFLDSKDGKAALKLLAAAGQGICLGYSEAVDSHASAVVIGGDGLKIQSGVTGLPVFSYDSKFESKSVSAAEAVSALRGFPREGNLLVNGKEDELIYNIVLKLDIIASDAP